MSDVDVPVIDLETQSDVEGFEAPISPTITYTSVGSGGLRRADSDVPEDKYRLYEVAGAPTRARSRGATVADRASRPRRSCGPHSCACSSGRRKVRSRPRPRGSTSCRSAPSRSQRVDEHGNATGGVRSPFLDVPLARYEVHATPGAVVSARREGDRPGGGRARGPVRRRRCLRAALRRGARRDHQRRLPAAADRAGILAAARAQARAAFAAG